MCHYCICLYALQHDGFQPGGIYNYVFMNIPVCCTTKCDYLIVQFNTMNGQGFPQSVSVLLPNIPGDKYHFPDWKQLHCSKLG
jgi:hypothetical protein